MNTKTFISLTIAFALVGVSMQACCTGNLCAVFPEAQNTLLTVGSTFQAVTPAPTAGQFCFKSVTAESGSCCDHALMQTKITEYIKAHKGRLAKKLADMDAAATMMDKDTWKANFAKAKDLILKALANADQLYKDQFNMMFDMLDPANFKANLSKFKEQVRPCMQAIYDSHLSHACAICSKNASDYVDTTANKVYWNSNICPKLVSNCAGARFLMGKLGMVAMAATSIDTFKDADAAAFTSQSTTAPTQKQRDDAAAMKNMASAYEGCAKDPSGCMNNNDLVQKWCKNFLPNTEDMPRRILTERELQSFSANIDVRSTGAADLKEGFTCGNNVSGDVNNADAVVETNPVSIKAIGSAGLFHLLSGFIFIGLFVM